MSAVAERVAASPRVQAARAPLAGRPVWVVGGTVRDALLGRDVDLDLAVDGDPEEAARAVARALGGPAFQLSETFGAWRVVARDPAFVCDITRLQGATIDDDLRQRDFTVNAMALPLEGGELIDPTGGLRDLERGVLRVASESAYAADPLRPLRLVRFATELGFAPDPDTERMTREAAPAVAQASGERIFAELRRVIVADRVLDGLDLADSLGVLAAVVPELGRLHGVEQSHFHHLDVYGHTLEVLQEMLGILERPESVFGELGPRVREVFDEPLADELTRGDALRFAALLHDIGKPDTRAELEDGRVSFIGHDKVGEQIIGEICARLRTSEKIRRFLGAIARDHLVLGFMVHERPLTREAAYRYLTRTDPVQVEVTALTCADRLATRGRNAEAAIAAHLDLARELMAEALDWRAGGGPRPPLRGDELARELGIEPGPEIGALLSRLREASFTGEATTREEAVALARRVRENG
jgi:poly(A) polymerase